jgi:protein-tyrosine phosphatase
MSMSGPGTAQKTILVVCAGNICRSPIAGAFINLSLEQARLRERVTVISAGLNVKPGQAPPGFVVNEIKLAYGLDLAGHRSQPVTPDLFQRVDLVLVMEQAQLVRLAQQYPRQTRKLRMLSELSGRVFDIRDALLDENIEIGEMAGQINNLVTNNFATLLGWLNLKPEEI